MRYLIVFFSLFMATGVSAQNIKRETVQVNYISRPSEPIPTDITSYDVTVSQIYRLEYEAEMEQWEADKEMARENFESESEAYNSKGTGAKILERALLDEKKPRLVLPVQPVKRERIFEHGVVSAKINMEGLAKASGGAVVEIDIQSFEGSDPVDSRLESKDKEGNISYKHYRSMKYRQPVRYTLTLPDGSIVIDEVIGSSEGYTTHDSNKYASTSALNKSWNQSSINDQLSRAAVEAALASIKVVLNDRYCFSKKTRSMTIYHAKTTKKGDYTELSNTALDMQMAMEKYFDNQEAAMEGIRACVPVWQTALEAADFENKKARINKKMAGFLYLNLIQANIWLEEYDKADQLFDEMRRLDTKKSAEGTAKGLDSFSEDQRRRKEVNS